MRLRVGWLAASAVLLLACDRDGSTGPPRDTTPPESVGDLRVAGTEPGNVNLEWSAPGDDGHVGAADRYDLRYAAAPPSSASWDSARTVQRSWDPKAAGATERVTVAGLRGGSWYFALRAADEAANWSEISNVVRAEIPPVLAGFSVTDLAVVANGAEHVRLRWTAPGDSVTGAPAVAYDLRYATAGITPETWTAATPISGLPAPAPRGQLETFTVSGLAPVTTYYFALMAADRDSNWSALSNVAEGTTGEGSYTYERLTTSSRIPGAQGGDWSPDGGFIVFAANWEDWIRVQLYRIPVEGGEPVKLTDAAASASWPRWSPDGQKIAYTTGSRELRVMEAASGGASVVLAAYASPYSPGTLDWSPDGRHLVYVVTSFPSLARAVYRLPATGGTPVLLLDVAVGATGPDWSPDGTKIAYASTREPYDIWILPADGGEATALPAGPGRNGNPCWSPDGARIAFSCDGDIWIMAATGESAHQVTAEPDGETPTSWSPDGRALCVQRQRVVDRVTDVWILRLAE